MPVRADASAVKNRLNKLRTGLRLAAADGTKTTADFVQKQVKQSASQLIGQQQQIGFDFVQFLQNIEGVTPLAANQYGNSFAILDTEKMGTAQDFEAIANIRGLWHEGKGAGEKFRRLVVNVADTRQQVEAGRQAVWGSKTPQWILLEYGSSGGIDTAGAMQPITPYNFIGQVINNEAAIFATWTSRIRTSMRSRGLL